MSLLGDTKRIFELTLIWSSEGQKVQSLAWQMFVFWKIWKYYCSELRTDWTSLESYT